MTCPHCDHPTDEHDVFCGACGAYLGRGAEPEMLRKMRTRRKNASLVGWTAFLLPLPFVILMIWSPGVLDMIPPEFYKSDVVWPCIFVAWIGWSGIGVLSFLRIWRCPACKTPVGDFCNADTHEEAFFCSNCGVRLRAGEGKVIPYLPIAEETNTQTMCACCGNVLSHDEQLFCSECGANVQWSGTSNLLRISKGIGSCWVVTCSRCGRTNLRTYFSRRKHRTCTWCGATELEPS